MNLFTVCSDNGQRLKAQYESGFSAEDRAKAEPFLEDVRERGRLSINRTPSHLFNILQERIYLNVHRFAERESGRLGKSVEDILHEKLKDKWFAKRVAFDSHFEAGTAFLYASLNIGNAGALHYGDYCIIWKRDLHNDYRTGYLEGDSLVRFVSNSNEVDEESLSVGCACHDTKQYLAVHKHRAVALSADRSLWANCLCNDGKEDKQDYIEAIFENGTGEVAISYIEEIRLPQENKKRYEDTEQELRLLDDEEYAIFEETDAETAQMVTAFQKISEIIAERGLPMIKGIKDA
ncbi:MAG: hypothetical protein NT023_07735 [Armatimonadetes bacterium]|nr:hypothetical protein [Armatimonadota bacterium]